jgi:hypothetical protein
MIEPLYDVTERAPLNFVGFMTEDKRYDFAIVHTNSFYGKTLVICMQSGRSATLGREDLGCADHLMDIYKLDERSEAEQLADFLAMHLNDHSCREEV